MRGSVGQSCIDDLLNAIVLDEEGKTRQLFTGFPGSGKTTELLRLQERLEAASDQPTYVLYVDVEAEFINPYAPLEPADLLRVVTYVLDREALRLEGKDPDRTPGYSERIIEYFRGTTIDLKSIQVEHAGVRLMAELRTDGPLRRTLSESLARRFQAFASEACEFANAAITRIKKATQTERVVLIVDGLEKVRPVREEDRGTFERAAEATFVENIEEFRLECHMVLTFPMWLRYRSPWLGGALLGRARGAADGEDQGALGRALSARPHQARAVRRAARQHRAALR